MLLASLRIYFADFPERAFALRARACAAWGPVAVLGTARAAPHKECARRAFHGWPGPAATARGAASGVPAPRLRATRARRRGPRKRGCGLWREESSPWEEGRVARRAAVARECGAARSLCGTVPRLSVAARREARAGAVPFAQAPDHPRSHAVGAEPCPAPASSRSAGSLLRQPRSAVAARRLRLTPQRRPRRHATPTAQRPHLTRRRRARAVGAGLQRHPFSGPADSVGGLLHTP